MVRVGAFHRSVERRVAGFAPGRSAQLASVTDGVPKMDTRVQACLNGVSSFRLSSAYQDRPNLNDVPNNRVHGVPSCDARLVHE